MLTDPIGDMIARIKNGYMARHKTVEMPFSKIKLELANILAEEKYVVSAEPIGTKPAEKQLKVKLRYERKEPAIMEIKRVSKPGLRIYKQSKELKVPLSGKGTGIVSTSKGLMTVRDAKKKKLGGELICVVW